MQSTLELLQEGADLQGSLCQVLLRERTALVAHEVEGLQAANDERDTLLARLAEWSDQAQSLLQAGAADTDAGGEPSLGGLVKQLPRALTQRGNDCLSRLRRRAEEAHQLAATNHILVSRNMDLVSRTLAFYTGGTAAATYTAHGAVADSGSQPVVEANG